jgi:hypothetical protein
MRSLMRRDGASRQPRLILTSHASLRSAGSIYLLHDHQICAPAVAPWADSTKYATIGSGRIEKGQVRWKNRASCIEVKLNT